MCEKKSVFPIIGKLNVKPEKFIILGTGFFIDSNGLFITAGHTFRKNINSVTQFFITFLEKEKSELIPIQSFKWISREIYGEIERRDHLERNRNKYQCGPEFSDIAVGKVNVSETPFYSFQRKRPFEWQKLMSPCYNRNLTTCPEKSFDIETNQIETSFLEYSEKQFKLKNRMQFARVYFMGENYHYKNIDLFNNCVELEGTMVKGNSGAPVLNDDTQVVGIILGGGNNSPTIIHLSKYILKKLKILKKGL